MHDPMPAPVPDPIKASVASQFNSALSMLTKAIELCPESLWLGGGPNRFWHVAYHALFYTHFYLAPSDAEFVAWEKHRPGYNYFGAAPGRPNEAPKVDEPYTQAELLEYAAFCRGEIESRIAAVDLDAPSGFYWLPINKFELQLYNLRHLAHHTGQLADRLRSEAGVGLPWCR
jgi:DinB superfamily